MEAASELLQAKFQKAESDLNHLTTKLELRCQDGAEGDSRKNPVELLRKVKSVKDEYKSLVQEAAEIQKAQAEAMDFFRSQLPLAMQALQQLQQAVGMDGTEEDKAKVEELQDLLGLQPLPQLTQSSSPGEAALQNAEGKSLPKHAEDAVSAPEASSLMSEAKEMESVEAMDSDKCKAEDPVALRAALRSESTDFVEVSQEEFESVSELICGRVKLAEVNSVYKTLYRHFKQENNSQALSTADMHKMGLRITGATGKAKLKVLRALKLLTISSKEEVKLT